MGGAGSCRRGVGSHDDAVVELLLDVRVRPGAQDEVLDLALVDAAPDPEVAPLPPPLAPRVGDDPVLDAVLLPPPHYPHGVEAGPLQLRVGEVLVDAGAVREEVVVHAHRGLHGPGSHDLPHDVQVAGHPVGGRHPVQLRPGPLRARRPLRAPRRRQGGLLGDVAVVLVARPRVARVGHQPELPGEVPGAVEVAAVAAMLLAVVAVQQVLRGEPRPLLAHGHDGVAVRGHGGRGQRPGRAAPALVLHGRHHPRPVGARVEGEGEVGRLRRHPDGAHAPQHVRRVQGAQPEADAVLEAPPPELAVVGGGPAALQATRPAPAAEAAADTGGRRRRRRAAPQAVQVHEVLVDQALVAVAQHLRPQLHLHARAVIAVAAYLCVHRVERAPEDAAISEGERRDHLRLGSELRHPAALVVPEAVAEVVRAAVAALCAVAEGVAVAERAQDGHGALVHAALAAPVHARAVRPGQVRRHVVGGRGPRQHQQHAQGLQHLCE